MQERSFLDSRIWGVEVELYVFFKYWRWPVNDSKNRPSGQRPVLLFFVVSLCNNCQSINLVAIFMFPVLPYRSRSRSVHSSNQAVDMPLLHASGPVFAINPFAVSSATFNLQLSPTVSSFTLFTAQQFCSKHHVFTSRFTIKMLSTLTF